MDHLAKFLLLLLEQESLSLSQSILASPISSSFSSPRVEKWIKSGSSTAGKHNGPQALNSKDWLKKHSYGVVMCNITFLQEESLQLVDGNIASFFFKEQHRPQGAFKSEQSRYLTRLPLAIRAF